MSNEKKSWIVTRIVREKFEVEHAENSEEAKNLAENPFSVEVVRESAHRWKPKQPRKDSSNGKWNQPATTSTIYDKASNQ